MENIIIGKRREFAIEVADYEEREGRIRFWVNNYEIGDLRVNDELETCANALRQLIDNKEQLYNSSFASRTDAEIFQYCLLLDSNILNRTEKDFERFRGIQHMSPFLGEQFDNVARVIYFKNGFYHFLWSYNNNTSDRDYLENLKVEKIEANIFEFVCESFIDFIYSD